jgi:hypothetical protein
MKPIVSYATAGLYFICMIVAFSCRMAGLVQYFTRNDELQNALLFGFSYFAFYAILFVAPVFNGHVMGASAAALILHGAQVLVTPSYFIFFSEKVDMACGSKFFLEFLHVMSN